MIPSALDTVIKFKHTIIVNLEGSVEVKVSNLKST